MWFVDCGFICGTVTAEDSARAWRHGAGPPFAVLFAVVFFVFILISILLASARGRIPLGSRVNCFVTFIYFALPLALLSCLIARERSGIVMNSGLVKGIREFIISGWGVLCWFQNAILDCGLVKVGLEGLGKRGLRFEVSSNGVVAKVLCGLTTTPNRECKL